MLSFPNPGQMTTGVLIGAGDDGRGTALNASQQQLVLLDAVHVTAQRTRMAARRRVMFGWCLTAQRTRMAARWPVGVLECWNVQEGTVAWWEINDA